MHIQAHDWPLDLRSDTNEVRKHLGVIRPRIVVGAVECQHPEQGCGYRDGHSNSAAKHFLRSGLDLESHNLCSLPTKSVPLLTNLAEGNAELALGTIWSSLRAGSGRAL